MTDLMTIVVHLKATGAEAVINVTDFDPALHERSDAFNLRNSALSSATFTIPPAPQTRKGKSR